MIELKLIAPSEIETALIQILAENMADFATSC